MNREKEELQTEQEIETALLNSLEGSRKKAKKQAVPPKELDIFPLLKRPFFPGMAAPIAIEPGPYFEVLKRVAKSDHKCLGLLLTKKDSCDIYRASFKDLYSTGVMARILRIIPMEQGGAQVILNMEKRFKIARRIKKGNQLIANNKYHDDTTKLTKKLKAYGISII